QFHMEVEADTVDMWSEIPEYRAALDSALGPDGVAQINAACAAEMGNFNKAAERIYMNWLQACAQGPGMR
ncbi:MAG: type 1 glutamine amidotransferase, partial [Pseudomonadota bacterium]